MIRGVGSVGIFRQEVQLENRGNIFKGNCYNSSSSLTFGHQMGSVRDCYGGRMQMLSLFLKKSLRGGGGGISKWAIEKYI